MKYLYQVYVGIKYDRDGEPISGSVRESAIDRIQHRLCLTFGGFTAIDAEGGWVHNDKLVCEPCIVYSVITGGNRSQVEYAARWIGRQLNQHSVCVVFPASVAVILECQEGPADWDAENHP